MDVYQVSAGVVSSGITLASFDEMNVLSGGTAISTTIHAGADLYVQFGGSTSSTTVNSGGGVFVTGVANQGTVNAGGFEYVIGGKANFTQVDRGAIERLSAGGIAFGSLLQAGGVQQALAGATVEQTTVSSGAYQFISSGSAAFDTVVSAGGYEEVLSGGTVTSTTVESGGIMVVLPGANVISSTVEAGGRVVSTGVVFNPNPPAVVLLGSAVTSLAVGRAASDYVLTGGTATATTLSSGGVQYVEAGGVAAGTRLRNGGTEAVSGGTAIGTTISGGGSGVFSLQDVGSGGAASGTSVFAGGAQNVSGGFASGTVLSAGAQFVEAQGLVSLTTVDAGGYQFIGAGGNASQTRVSSGGSEAVSGGTAYATDQSSGGRDFVAFGGTLESAVLSGDTTLGPGGTVSDATLYNGAHLTIDGGTASGVTIQSGGLELLSGNTTYVTAVSEAFDSMITGGGAEVVEARSVESDPTIAGGALVLAGGVVSGGIDFSGIGGKLIIDETIPPDALITGFTVADAIELATVSYASGATFSVTGQDQIVISAGGGNYTLNIAGAQLDAPHFLISEGSDGNVLLTETAPCFAAGTHILTPLGEVAVERLSPGDVVITPDGDAPIIWIGRRRLDLSRHMRPASVQPVRFAADSLGEGVPSRDLIVSPDHALFIDGVLIPAKALINGRNVCQQNRPKVTYYHVELAAHGVIFADGTAVESYLETGNRGAFENGETALILHPDLAQTMREAKSCAPFTDRGPIVDAVALRLLQRHYAAIAAPRRRSPLFRHG